MLACRPASSASSRGVEHDRLVRPRDPVSRNRERERRQELEVVLVHGRGDELPRVVEREALATLGETALHRVEPGTKRLQRLDREPALVGPLPEGDPVPGDERGVEPAGIVDTEV
jgi:hypothetical protein